MPRHHAPQHQTQARQLAIQTAGLLIYLVLAWPFFSFQSQELPWPESAFGIGIAALIVASYAKQPWWWRVIHLTFVPMLWKASQFGIDPGWYLLAFIALTLIFRGAAAGRIPLFLSNATTVAALAEIIAERNAQRLIDLGAGIGSVVAPLAANTPTIRTDGIENAPASWLIGYLRTRGLRNCDWMWGDFWEASLTDYDVVYAFLSPEPMPQLWKKACDEMPAGSLFISNSFHVPGVTPNQIIELDDRRGTVLYCYEL